MQDNIPVAGLSGHVIGKNVRTTLEDGERVKIMSIRGCPVNKRILTKMTEDAFVRSCKVHQAQANIGGKKKVRSKMSLDGFRENNQYVCNACRIRKRINAGGKFKPPVGVEFLELTSDCVLRSVPKKRKKRRKVMNQKLTEDGVRNVRKMIAAGVTVKEIRAKLNNVITLRAIYDIKTGKTWSHIT